MSTRKIISLFLAIAMLFSMVSVSVFAEEAEIAEIVEEAVAEEDTAEEETTATEENATEEIAEETANFVSDEQVSEEDSEEVSIEEEVVSEEVNADAESQEEIAEEETTEKEIMLMAIEPDTAYTVLAGLTKTFQNLATVDLNAVIRNGNFDYCLYYEDGSVKEFARERGSSTISVPAGGTLKITARNNNVDCTIADDYFMVEDMEESVFNTRIMADRTTFEFTNTNVIPVKLLSTSHSIDYVIYGIDGKVKEQVRDTYFNNKEIPAGNTIKITAREDNLEVCPLYECFDVAESSTQVFKKVLVSVGDTYSFTNTSDIPYDLLSNYTQRDYVVYDADGTINQQVRETDFNKKPISAGNTIKITARNSGLELCGLTECFDFKKEETQVFNKLLIPAGDTYSFTNTSDAPYNLLSNYTQRDYVVYDADGNVIEYKRDTEFNKKEIPSGSIIKITARDSGLEVCGLTEVIKVARQATPVFNKVIMPIGETYSFTNKSDESYQLLSDYTQRDYVVYDADGNVIEYKRDTEFNNKEIPSGSTIKITSRDSHMEICALMEIFDVKKEDKQVFNKVLISAGDTYTFKNTSKDTYKLLSSYDARDYVMYTADGSISADYKRDTDFNSKEISAGNTIKITARYSYLEVCALNEVFEVAKTDVPVFKKVVIAPQQQYKFINTSGASIALLGSGYINYTIYNSVGSATSSKTDVWMSSIAMASGYSMGIYSKDSWVEICALSEAFTVSYAGTDYTELKRGKSYEITNTSIVDYSIYWDNNSCIYDFIVYGSENTVVNHASAVGNHTITIPGGGRAVITPKTDFSIKNDDKITVSEYKVPVYKTVEVTKGETVIFENTALVGAILNLTSGYYDYIIYNKADTVISYVTTQYIESLTVPAESKVAITVRDGKRSVFARSDAFNISFGEDEHFVRRELSPGETVKIKNTSLKDYNILVRGRQFDYVMYNADCTVREYALDLVHRDYTVATNAYIVITAREPVYVEVLNEAFVITDEDVPAFSYDAIYSGETLVVKNSSVKDYYAYIYTDYYDFVCYDATDKIATAGMEANVRERKYTPGMSEAISAISGSGTIITLNDVFKANTRSYPAMMRKTVYQDEEYVFTNAYTEKLYLHNSGKKLNYAIFTETDSLVESDEEVYTAYMEIPAGGRVEVDIKSANVTFAGPYEAFSGEDLTVKVTGVKLSANTLTLAPGKQALLKATVMPEDATNKTVIWQSSDTSVATVAQTGKVVAKGYGTAIITVTTEDGEYTSSCVVTVSDGTAVTLGDANGDGEIDFADAIVVLKHDAGVATLTGDKLTAADANADGDVDFVDAILILKYDSGLIPSFK